MAVLAAAPASALADAATPVAAPPPLPGGAHVVGPAPGFERLPLRIVLAPRDPAALDAFVAAVSTPGSPEHGHYLDKGEFAQRFGPTDAAADAVRQTLAADGIDVAPAPSGTTVLEATATVAQAEAAFDTPIAHITLANGRSAVVNEEPATLPAAVADDVVAVSGLDTTPRIVPHDRTAASASTRPTSAGHVSRLTAAGDPTACTAALSTAQANGAWPAEAMAQAYDFTRVRAAGGRGAGVTVGLLEYEQYDAVGVQNYQDCYGTNVSIYDVDVDGGPTAGLTNPEATLDLEAVIGLAPRTSLVIYQGPLNSTTNWLDVMAKAADEDRADVISSSYGFCEPQIGPDLGPTAMNAESVILAQMAVQGQTFMAAAGDDGSSDCIELDPTIHSVAVDDPGSQPLALSVGGTSMSAIGNPPATAPTETTWNDPAPYPSGGGGGISAFHVMPAWQRSFTTAQSSAAPCSAPTGWLCRQVPDVSAVADPNTGYVINYNGTGNGPPGWQVVGGTSAASPLWAALLASIQSTPGCSDRFGLVAPALYRLGSGGGAGVFNDVTVGDNVYDNYNPGFYPALTGYDMATGLGTPIGGGLMAGLCPAAPAPTPTPYVPPASDPTTTTAPPAGPPAPAVTVPTPAATTAATPAVPDVTVQPGVLTLRDDRVSVPLRCPAGTSGGCRVTVSLRGRGLAAQTRTVTLAAGRGTAVPVALPADALRQLRHTGARQVRVRVRVVVVGADGSRHAHSETRTVRIGR